MNTFLAKYRTVCRGCDETIEPGDVAMFDGEGPPVHAKVECVQPDGAYAPGGVARSPEDTKFKGTTLEEMGY